MSIPQSQQKSPQKAVWAALVFASLAAFAFVLINLPYQYRELNGEWLTNTTIEFQSISTGTGRCAICAGVPFRFYETWESDQGRGSVFWSTTNLLLDLLLACSLVVIVYRLSRMRYRMIAAPQTSHRKCVCFDGLVVVSCVAGILLVGWSLYSETQRHYRLIADHQLNGICYISCEVPAIIQSKVPSQVNLFFSRVRVVIAHQPSNACLAEILRLKTLKGMLLHGGKIEAADLERLRGMPQFTSLHLNSLAFTPQHVSVIGQIHQLETLNLSNTNIDGALLRHLDGLERLRSVSLKGTPLRLADLGTPDWKDSVQHLQLPRQVRGPADQIKIDQWVELEVLSIVCNSFTISPQPIRIELTNCPQFRRLTIDRVQKHDLVARGLPKFQEITEDIDEQNFFGATLDGMPRENWFGVLELENVPSLKDVGAYANELTSVRITNAPSLQEFTVSNCSYIDHEGNRFSEPQPEVLQRIINQLGKCDGPPRLGLERLDLRPLDLSPLVKNQGLREFRFFQSQIGFSQIRQLAGLTRLRTITAELCETNSQELAWLLETFPEMEKVNFDISDMDELALQSRYALASFTTRPLKQVKRVHVQDVPELQMDIHVDCPIDDLQVINAPHLTGLGLAEPWPSQAEVSGLRGLKWFAAGGASVDDSVLESVLYCRSLDRLMLAYPSVSKDALRRIGGFYELTSLVIPGSCVDDSVTSNYEKLAMLREVNFDDCRIGAATIRWLLGIESLRRLSINHVKLSREAWTSLVRMKQLNELEISDVNVPDDVFAELLKNLRLENLSIAGKKLSQESFEYLKQNRSLRLLNVCRCELTTDQLGQLLDANKMLLIYCDDAPDHREGLSQVFALASNSASSSSSAQRSPSRRLIDKEQYLMFRLLLANYGVPQNSMLRNRYLIGEILPNLDQAFFGWFEASKFRNPSRTELSIAEATN